MTGPAPAIHPAPNTSPDIAARVRALSIESWGPRKAVEFVAEHPRLHDLLRKVEKFAQFNEPILITGESGVGKELFAQACYLLSSRRGRPFVTVNCPQFQDGNLTVSELFGHKRGSFTGALADHTGLFESADGGVIFLDEIADLHMSAQVMLLRALASGEFKPLGERATRSVNVRVIAATNRSLENQMLENEFRNDLYFRLRYLRLPIPPLRERGADWRLLVDHYLARLNAEHGVHKTFSPEALDILATYHWPGNIRELRSIVTMGYSLADSEIIEPRDFLAELGTRPHCPEPAAQAALYQEMVDRKRSFWDVVHGPFLDRDLNRAQVQSVIGRGLLETRGSYRHLIDLFHVSAADYHKFMDFLRHHRLKPDHRPHFP